MRDSLRSFHHASEIFSSFYPGIVDIGIEYCGTVCSQHHTVWEDPRGSRRRFERIQRVGVQDMCSRVELILKKHQNLYVPIKGLSILGSDFEAKGEI